VISLIEVIFSVNPEDLKKCPVVGSKDFGTWDIFNQKMWIWLFRFNRKVEADEIIKAISYTIEHEWLHELFARYVPYYYKRLMHWIIWHQQAYRLCNKKYLNQRMS